MEKTNISNKKNKKLNKKNNNSLNFKDFLDNIPVYSIISNDNKTKGSIPFITIKQKDISRIPIFFNFNDADDFIKKTKNKYKIQVMGLGKAIMIFSDIFKNNKNTYPGFTPDVKEILNAKRYDNNCMILMNKQFNIFI